MVASPMDAPSSAIGILQLSWMAVAMRRGRAGAAGRAVRVVDVGRSTAEAAARPGSGYAVVRCRFAAVDGGRERRAA